MPVEDKPLIKEDINLIIEKLLTPAGERFFLSPNLLNKKLYAPQKVEKRKTDFMTPINYLDRDTIEYELPANMAVEYKPEDVFLKSEFGEYRAIYKIERTKITYIRIQQMNNNRYPPSKYNDYITFYKAVTKADKSKILIKKI